MVAEDWSGLKSMTLCCDAHWQRSCLQGSGGAYGWGWTWLRVSDLYVKQMWELEAMVRFHLKVLLWQNETPPKMQMKVELCLV